MYALHIKDWFGHTATGHNAVLRIEHLIHDERFWVIFAVAAMVTLLAFAIWVGTSTGADFGFSPLRPVPFGYPGTWW